MPRPMTDDGMAAAGRTAGPAVKYGVVAALLTVGPSVRLSAQLSLRPSLGLRYTSTMVRDTIVEPLTVRPALAPTLALTVTTPTARRLTWGE